MSCAGPETTCAQLIDVRRRRPEMMALRSELARIGVGAGSIGIWKVCPTHAQQITHGRIPALRLWLPRGWRWQTLGIRLNGDSRDFTATHKRLLTAEVAERLNIVKPAVSRNRRFLTSIDQHGLEDLEAAGAVCQVL